RSRAMNEFKLVVAAKWMLNRLDQGFPIARATRYNPVSKYTRPGRFLIPQRIPTNTIPTGSKNHSRKYQIHHAQCAPPLGILDPHRQEVLQPRPATQGEYRSEPIKPG